MGAGKFLTFLTGAMLLATSVHAQGDLEESAVRDPIATDTSPAPSESPHRATDRRRNRDTERDYRDERKKDKDEDDRDDDHHHHDHDYTDHLARVKRPFGLQASLGDPAPSLLGIGFSWQSNPFFQWLLGTGVFWTRDFRIQTLEASVRLHILPFDLTPIVGGGVAVHFFNGKGSIQGLDESLLLGSVLLGGDWAFDSGFRVSAGVQFHFPVKLVFPFVDFGLIF